MLYFMVSDYLLFNFAAIFLRPIIFLVPYMGCFFRCDQSMSMKEESSKDRLKVDSLSKEEHKPENDQKR